VPEGLPHGGFGTRLGGFFLSQPLIYELCDACIEHLGVLPSQLSLSPAQCKELLAYHRIKNKSQNICPDCVDKSQVQPRECFICGSIYTDKQGVVERHMEDAAPEDGGVNFQSSDGSYSTPAGFMTAVLPKSEKTDEEISAMEHKWVEKMGKHKVMLTQEEMNEKYKW